MKPHPPLDPNSLTRRLPAIAIVSALLVAAAISLVPTPSYAGVGQCSSGTACGWDANTYSGRYMKASNKVNDYKTIRWNDDSKNSPQDAFNSVANRGKSCDVVFWKDTYHKGDAIRFNRPSKGGTTQDPYLKNGGGYSHSSRANSMNWENKISSHSWVNCK